MRTSACCRLEPALKFTRGFTLFELVVVLAVVSLIAGLAFPRLEAAWVAVMRRADLASLTRQITGLSVRAFALGTPIVLDAGKLDRRLADGEPVLAVPAGWTVRMPKPIHYGFSGFCDGGVVELAGPDGWQRTLRLEAPACDELRDASGPG